MNCTNCGVELPEGALFCGECGRSVASSAAAAARATAGVRQGQPTIVSGETPAPVPTPTPGFVWPEPEPETELSLEPPAPEAEPEPEPEPEPELEPEPEPDHDDDTEDDDTEATRIVVSSRGTERFVLQFSTGESVTVFGTGLIGRNPAAEPGEYFDRLVTIVDPGKSVSKTHLEFGNVSGAFWISDRHSGNGTIVREPDAQPRRVEPGKRARIVRGSRVDIGEQFFIVS